MAIITALALTACVSDIDIQVPDGQDTYIIEGHMEQGRNAYVLVSHTLPYNSTIGLTDLFELLVTEAEVTVRSGNESERLLLVEDTMYSLIPVYRGYRLKGEPGRSYTLEVKIGDKIFTGVDTMPQPIGPDSLWFLPEGKSDSLGYVHIRIADPPEPGNRYRIFTRRLGIDLDYNAASGGILDDHLFNGISFDLPLIRSGFGTETGDKHFFRREQRVVVKTGVISSRYFDFISKVSNEMGQTLSPLSFQAPAVTMMDGGALGGWGCYAVTLDTIDIK